MAYFFQIIEMEKEDIPELSLTDVVTKAQVTMVCDYLGARRLAGETVVFSKPTSASGFTAFNDLTEAQVQNWVETAMGSEVVAALHEQLKRECDEAMNGKQNLVTTPPWVTLSAE